MSVTAITQMPAQKAPAQEAPTRPDEVELERSAMAAAALDDGARGVAEEEWLAIVLTDMAAAALS
jgi:hypothetical protein